jgi:diguanylate cyclase (GGDEF)-like protein
MTTDSAADIVPRQYGKKKVERMEQLAELVIHELEFRQQAKKDRLTGALTRSGFSVEVQKAISLYDRQGIKSTLVVFDVDLYKMVRHRFGRPSGNALLRSIIQPLVSRLRRTDCIGRLGGTQFAVLLTSTTEAKALRATEEMQREMEQTNTKIFFDVGYCEISEGMGICDDWLKQADIILLDAKTAGRNEIDEDSDRQYDLVS